MVARFLCCMPVRFGVLLFTFGEFLLAAIAAGALIFGLVDNDTAHRRHVNLSSSETAGAITLTVVLSLIAIISLIGFCFAAARNIRAVRIFGRILIVVLLIETALSIACIVEIYTISQDKYEFMCNPNPTYDLGWAQYCLGHPQSIKGTIVGVVVAILLLKGWETYMVNGYVYVLEDQARKRNLSNVKYTAQNIAEETAPSSGAGPEMTGYPYTDAPNSHGSTSPYTASHHSNSNRGNAESYKSYADVPSSPSTTHHADSIQGTPREKNLPMVPEDDEHLFERRSMDVESTVAGKAPPTYRTSAHAW